MYLKSVRIEAEETNGYEFKDGALYRNAVAGQFLDRTRATRNAGDYKIYIDSFPSAALPYSVYRIADTKTGKVYTFELTHYTSFGVLDKIVAELKGDY